MTLKNMVVLCAVVAAATCCRAEEEIRPTIAWYGTLDEGLNEAARSGRPILLVSAAPQCLGVSGIW